MIQYKRFINSMKEDLYMGNKQSNLGKLNLLFSKYNIINEEKDYLLKIIDPIFSHEEFQKRMSAPFFHHGEITLGEHILEVTIVTYLLSKKYKNNKEYRLDKALQISMMHDLYEIPWQNNKQAKTKKFTNKHGFRHPIEAVINATIWYPDLFDDCNEILIDGIIHHMYPLPVRVFTDNNNNSLEIKNYFQIDKLTDFNKRMIIKSSKRKKIGNISICRSLYKEGRVMSKADKLVSIRQIKNLDSAISLITGYNKKLKKEKN